LGDGGPKSKGLASLREFRKPFSGLEASIDMVKALIWKRAPISSKKKARYEVCILLTISMSKIAKRPQSNWGE
jgi:hypothetical protein